MREFGFELLILLLLVIGNGVFALSEIAIISSRKARLQQWANEGRIRAAKALELAKHPSRFLATVQVGITLVGTLAGAYGGVALTNRLASTLAEWPFVAPYSRGIALGVVVVGVTYFQVVVGELVPKALALRHADSLALFVAGPMRRLSVIATPVVWLLGASTDLLLRLFGSKAYKVDSVTSEEVALLIAQGAQDGVFDDSQRDMVESVIELGDRRVNSIMVPRPEVEFLEVDASPNEVREKILETHRSRFPVCKGGLDHVIGVAHTKDMLAEVLAGREIDLATLSRKVPTIPETIPVLKALEAFKESGMPMALIIDEYGSLQGLVTLNDILEEIVGDLPSQDGQIEEPEAVQREDGSWLVDGMQAIDDTKEMIRIKSLPGEEENSYQTLGGFVMNQLGRIPRPGDVFVVNGYQFEVLDMDGHRVDKVLLTAETSADDAVSVPGEG
jgi:putative hemolysin